MKNLLFFTSDYPYLESKSFVDNEIDYLCEKFEHVYIFPSRREGEPREIPANCHVIPDVFAQGQHHHKMRVLIAALRYFKQVLELFLLDFLVHRKKIKDTPGLLIGNLRLISKAAMLEKWLQENKVNNAVFYTYWLNHWSTTLGVLKSRGIISGFISRAHGYEVYDCRHPSGIIPNRVFQLKHVSAVHFVSSDGKNYMAERYPKYAAKMRVSYLGTDDRGLNQIANDEKIHLLSCSRVIPFKRVHLIVEILKNTNKEICWTHLGEGANLEQVKAMCAALGTHVKVDFRGQQTHEAVLNYLENSNISFFINVSDSEGLPVSIMEAISFGIPVIATDVGGTHEIVNAQTGILIDKNFDPASVSVYLDDYFDSQYSSARFRKGVRDFWRNNFMAAQNFTAFAKEISS